MRAARGILQPDRPVIYVPCVDGIPIWIHLLAVEFLHVYTTEILLCAALKNKQTSTCTRSTDILDTILNTDQSAFNLFVCKWAYYVTGCNFDVGGKAKVMQALDIYSFYLGMYWLWQDSDWGISPLLKAQALLLNVVVLILTLVIMLISGIALKLVKITIKHIGRSLGVKDLWALYPLRDFRLFRNIADWRKFKG